MLEKALGGSSGARDILERLGKGKARMCSERELSKIAGRFVEWSPLVRYLAARRGGGGLDQRNEARLGELCKRLAGCVAKCWQTSVSAFGREDAVQEALLHALDTVNEPGKGYSYESDLLSWLVHIALNRLLAAHRRGAKRPTLADGLLERLGTKAGDAGDVSWREWLLD